MDNTEKPNKDKAAFATCNESNYCQVGLTKREYFAGLAMEAMIHKINGTEDKETLQDLSGTAVWFADSLLKELEKQ